MQKIVRRGSAIEVSPYESAWIVCVFAGGMVGVGVKLLIDQCLEMERFHWMDAVGDAFLLLWIGLALWMGFKASELAKTVLVFCDEGIVLAGPRRTRELKWEAVQDYGLHYIGKNRSGAHLYELYFADRPQKQKNGQTRRLDKETIRIHIHGTEEYDQIMNQLMPYCRTKLQSEPFLAGRFLL